MLHECKARRLASVAPTIAHADNARIGGIFFRYLSQMIYPGDANLASFIFGSVESLMPALGIDTIYQWREAACAAAKQKIESI